MVSISVSTLLKRTVTDFWYLMGWWRQQRVLSKGAEWRRQFQAVALGRPRTRVTHGRKVHLEGRAAGLA